MDWSSILTTVAPKVLEVAGTLIGSNDAAGDNKEAASAYNAATQAAADRVTRGYAEQLGFLEGGADIQAGLNDQALKDVTDRTVQGSQGYGMDTRRNYTQYSDMLRPEFEQFSNGLEDSDTQYRYDLGQLGDEVAGTLEDGSAKFAEEYAPYQAAGEQALNYQQQVLGQDPNQLTRSQRYMMDDYTRDAVATLAASGLRGAGRAGVAAVNDGRGRLMADLFNQNQSRSDAAAGTLGTQGYNATSNVAGNVSSLADKLGDLRLNIGDAAASSRKGTLDKIASTGYDLGNDIATKKLASEENIANNNFDTSKNVAAARGQYYTNLGNIEGQRYLNRGNTAMQTANAEAAATGAIGSTNFNTSTANNTIKNNALGTVTSIVRKGVEDVLARSGGQQSVR